MSCQQTQEPHEKPDETLQANVITTASEDSVILLRNFTIQVAALTNKENARKLESLLQNSDLPATVRTEKGLADKLIYRVLVGGYITQNEAKYELETVKKLGFSTAFIKENSRNELINEETSDLASDEIDLISTKQLTFTSGCSRPRWSPNNREIAFVKKAINGTGIYSIGTGGGQISKIVEDSKNISLNTKFSWSPSGKKIAFVAKKKNAYSDEFENIFVINKDGAGLKGLLDYQSNSFRITDFKWSPDDEKIALTVTHVEDDFSLKPMEKVVIISLKQLGRTDQFSSNYSVDLSYLEKSGCSVGWKSATELFYLYKDSGSYDLWLYDFSNKERDRIAGSLGVKNCQALTYLSETNYLVFIEKEKILSLDLASRKRHIMFEPGNTNLSKMQMSKSMEVFLIASNKLWVLEPEGRTKDFDIQTNSFDFTVSPSGNKICFAEEGNLFVVRLRGSVSSFK